MNLHQAIVEDIGDPLESNRVRVRVIGVHSDSKDQLSTGDLPWADAIMPATSAGTSGAGQTHGLVRGSWVFVTFRDDEFQQPIIVGSMSGRETGSTRGTYPLTTGNSLPVEATSRYKNSATFTSKKSVHQQDVPTATPARVTSVAVDKDDSYYQTKPWSAPAPESRIRPSYPHNNVSRSTSGIVTEIDDTPGAERHSVMHPSGSYREIIAVGDEIIVVRGDQYTTIFGGSNVYVKGTCNLTIDGDTRHLIKGDYHLEVDGDMTTNVKGSHNIKVGNSVNQEIGQDLAVNVAERRTSRVAGSSEDRIGGDMSIAIAGEASLSGAAGFTASFASSANIISAGDLSVATGGSLGLVASSGLKLETHGDMSIKASMLDLQTVGMATLTFGGPASTISSPGIITITGAVTTFTY